MRYITMKYLCLLLALVLLCSCGAPAINPELSTPANSESSIPQVSVVPTDTPTAPVVPSEEPPMSVEPEPSEEPTTSVEPEPSLEPEPSVEPEPEPSAEPEPSEEPSPEPEPSVEPEPSPEPSVEPSPEPSVEPEPADELVPGTVAIGDFQRNGRDIVVYGNVPDSQAIAKLEKLLDSYNKNVSLLVYSLDGSGGFIYNGQYEYPSQCTVKISWGYYVCKRIDEGKYSAADIFTYKSSDYYKGSGSIQHMAYGTKLTLEEVVGYMIRVSDNTAYNMITKYVDKADFDAFIDERGYQSYKLGAGKLWSYNSIVTDYASIWTEIYEYLQTDTEGARILREACTNSPYNYGTYTLKGEDYSHKSGYYWGSVCAYNDAGIVWADQPYVYAIFTRSEGTTYDINFVNNVMSIVHEMY